MEIRGKTKGIWIIYDIQLYSFEFYYPKVVTDDIDDESEMPALKKVYEDRFLLPTKSKMKNKD